MLKSPSRIFGLIGTIAFVTVFIHTPSFPTPDKLLVFITLFFMIFGQGWNAFKRFAPFVAILLVYESFRGLVPRLNILVNYGFMPAADKLLFFGRLPTRLLQNILWHGTVQWYDFVFYGAYTLHFVLPFALAVAVWKLYDSQYWRVITTYLLVSFMGFLTFLAFPAAPPWLANDLGKIEPITRVSSAVWNAFGIHDFPSVYNKISPNPVAAMPSLHAAYAMLFALFVTMLFKIKWRWAAWVYPLLIWVGTTYQGEHYAIDIIVGVIYAVIAYFAAPYIVKAVQWAWYTKKA
jgi:membrane-associated phospholipid phosphatase